MEIWLFTAFASEFDGMITPSENDDFVLNVEILPEL